MTRPPHRTSMTILASILMVAVGLVSGCGGSNPVQHTSSAPVQHTSSATADVCHTITDAQLRTLTGQAFHVVDARRGDPSGSECDPLSPDDSPVVLRWTIDRRQGSLTSEARLVADSGVAPRRVVLSATGAQVPALVTTESPLGVRTVRVVTTSGDQVMVVEATQSELTASAPSLALLRRTATAIATSYVARN